MNADGSGQRNLTRNTANDYLWPSICLVARRAEDRLRTRPQRGRQQRRHLRHQRRRQRGAEADASGRRPLWSPDGQKIAFLSKRNGNNDIYVMNPDGSGQRNLTHNPARIDDGFVWSPVQK